MIPLRPLLALVGAVLLSSLAVPTHGELSPFVLPWDDAEPGPTAAFNLLHPPAGSQGRVRATEDGHFATDVGRIRFWGVNVVAYASFLDEDTSEAVAGRLAKFGFNAVRFHLLDQNWDQRSLIDYSQGNSRTLDAEALAGVHHFSAALKERGLYWNYNLLAGREFFAADGLPAEIESLGWKEQEGVGIIEPTMLALQKEYARDLLTTVNPYTGLRPVDDPALAIVEINNENGLIAQWYQGNVDTWPAVFRADLQAMWNAWLSARYPDDETLRTAWDTLSAPLGANLISNSTFATSTGGWYLEQHEGAAATATVGTWDGRTAVRVSTTKVGTQEWHVQLSCSGLSFQAGQVYTFSYWLRGDGATSATVYVGEAHDPWSTVLSNARTVNSAWQHYEKTFIAPATDANMRVVLGGMGTRLGTVYLTGIELRPGGSIGELPADASLVDGSIPLVRREGAYRPAQLDDWYRFLRDKETAYWTEMRRYVREDLGYPGIVVGTINSTSTPGTQARMDALDSHAYWQHPVFYGYDWNPDSWSVGNVSMVNETSGNIGDLAAQRVKGKPFLVTEYQHPSPNPHGSESPLMIAAYGALQDWDGIFQFTYGDSNDNWDRARFASYFDLDQHPPRMAASLVAAHLFLRGDVAPAREEVVMNFDADTELEVLRTWGRAWAMADARGLGMSGALPLVHRVSLDVNADGPGSAPPTPTPTTRYSSDTGELDWVRDDPAAGYIVVDTPRTKSLIGFTDGQTVTFTGGLSVTPGTTDLGWSTISVTAMAGSVEHPAPGTRLLVVTTGNVENTGMKWTDASHISVGRNWGTGPTLIERVPATLQVPVTTTRLRAWALDGLGQRMTAMQPVQGITAASSSIALGTLGTLWYEVEVLPTAAFTDWAGTAFGGDAGNPAVSGPSADPDADGWSNWQEYAFGTEPLRDDSPFVTGADLPLTDGASAYHYLRWPERPGLTLDVEWSTDCKTWSKCTTTPHPAAGASVLRVEAPASPGAPVFIRPYVY